MEATIENTTTQWQSMKQFAVESAKEYWEQNSDMDESDYCHQQADGAHDVIYTACAWDAVMACRANDSARYDEAHDSLRDTEGDRLQEGEDIDNIIVRLSYWIHYAMIMAEIEDQRTDAEEEE